MRSRFVRALLFACLLPSSAIIAQGAANTPATSSPATAQPSVINAQDAAKILPPSVFFRGLSAPIQGRNSGGVRFADKRMMLVALVDTSGYSSQIQEKYQAYLITESALDIEGHSLPPGAYGCGFIAGDTFIVQDIGAHDLFTAHSTHDAALRRPTPLQVLADPDGGYRLYIGRSYIPFRAATGQ